MRDNFNEDALPVEPNMHDQRLYGGTQTGRFDSSKQNQANTPKGDCTIADLGRAINDLTVLCRKRADSWYYDLKTGERLVMNDGERFMLMVTELAEAFEGKRKNLMDSHLPHRKAVEVECADELVVPMIIGNYLVKR